MLHAEPAPAELDAFERFCFALLRTERGDPLVLEPFQRMMLADYFAGVRETLILLSKKNYKTTTLGALSLFHLLATPDAECVIGASSRDQATILYDQASGFIRRSEKLRERVTAKRGYREIRSLRDNGRIRVLAADVDTADGVIPTLALVDELHRHRSADLYGIFRDGLGPRHGQMVTISTAGDRETSPLGVMRAAARQLPLQTDGRYSYARAEDGSFAMHEWALLEGDDLDNMEVVKLVNPASIHTVELLAQRHNSPSMLPWQWARFACGMWVGAAAWWIKPTDWHDARTVGGRLERRDKITLGFDGSRYGDATALIGCRLEDGLLVPLGVWEAPKGSKSWEVPASEVDAAIANAFETYNVVRAYLDPPLWQSEIDNWAREYGEIVMRYPTNRARFMQATERFRTDLIEGNVRHNGDERLTRHVLGAQVREARGGYWLDKASSTEKIDCAIASILAYEARCDALAQTVKRTGYAFL